MVKKFWSECPKEERLAANRLIRCHRMLNYMLHHKVISQKKYDELNEIEFRIADYLEWYYSDRVQDIVSFYEWKKGYQMYEQVRGSL